GEAGAAPGHDVDDELGVAPIFELRRPDVEGTAGDLAEPHVLAADPELAGRVAHRRRAVAAAARLMEHQRAMLASELFHHCRRSVGDEHARNHRRRLPIFVTAGVYRGSAEAGAPGSGGAAPGRRL